MTRPARAAALALAIGLGVTAATASPSGAAWTALGPGTGATRSAAIAPGPRPDVAPLDDTVVVSWSAPADGSPVDTYRVFRRVDDGTATPAGGDCAAVGDGRLSCTDTDLPATGHWRYVVAMSYRSWHGPTGPASLDAVTMYQS